LPLKRTISPDELVAMQAAAERMLEATPEADLALSGFPRSWEEPEMCVFLGPIGEYDFVKIAKDDSDIPVCLVRTRVGHVPALIVARLRTSRLISEGLEVVLNRNATREANEVPMELQSYQFRSKEKAALFNLRSQVDLNGSPCTILSYNKEAARWLVRLDLESDDTDILVSQVNLLPLWVQAGASTPAPLKAPREASASPKSEAEEIAEDADGDGDPEPNGSRGDAEPEPEREEGSEAEEAPKSKATKGKVKASHAVVVTGFPLWDASRITEYFARFGELRTILGADKAKHGKRKLLVAYCRKLNARRSQSHVNGAEVDGLTLQAFFPEDAPRKSGPTRRREPPGEHAANE